MYFVKLFSTITTSSISDEDVHVRWVWIVCLTLCDKNGNFHATTTSLARLANVPLEQVEEAMEILCAPDPKSTSQENEGRRIERVSTNEWHVFNFTRYKSLRDPDEVREKTRERVAKHRAKGSNVTHVTKCNTQVTESNDNIEIDIEFSADAEEIAGEEEIVANATNYKGDDAWMNDEEETPVEEDDIDAIINGAISTQLRAVPFPENSSSEGWEEYDTPEPLTVDEAIQSMFDTHNYLAIQHHKADPASKSLIQLTWEELQQSELSQGDVEVLEWIGGELVKWKHDPVLFTMYYFEKFHNSNKKLDKTRSGDLRGLAGIAFPSRAWMMKNSEKLLDKFRHDNVCNWTSRLYPYPEEVMEVACG